ncbi:aminotransferase class I/II-fold pyridoxal phosphate-dependent enzyme [Sphingopyxis sp.]|uniref:aminotransferase class I/II-fold pyridoxal phosphate-dependent enzyme n=1 Tax=Sphingopyxis sp. TaxID=1908224 RepID=UPI002D779308|nr:aminotransferase class I/II-fold pyridoxal phosphate-dependent enzyme [Sphingopyxis sp.]HET6525349.1 aminotransferase class I/II-fold pyridoxal phosphate-dependent enzyme [Sphingopyxis sp.]
MSEPWTWHGGGIEAAKRAFGGDDWIDLSTGINPQPWPGAGGIAFDWRCLPEPEHLSRLERVAADYFGVDPRHVCAVPGSEIGLRLVGTLIDGDTAHIAPGYRTHGEVISGSAETRWGDAPGAAGNLILANPNNPDGRVLAPDGLLEWLERRAGWLIVDEAFADTDPALSVAAAVADHRKLIVFRSFGKFFGLAGLRLGFVLAPQTIVATLRARLGAWPLSEAAIAIGAVAYADASWIEATRRRLPGDAAALDAMLARHGYRAAGACPLFRLIETDNGRALFERLARHAILTRPFADQPRWLRLGLPADAAALARLDAALGDG